MATQGFGTIRRQAMTDFIAGKAPTAPGGFSVALWVADTGEDGQSGAEVTASGYSRGSITNNTGWTATTSATPSVLANAAVINFGTFSASASGVTNVALWTTTGTTAANFIGRAVLTGAPLTIPSGATVSIAIGALTMSSTSS